MLLAVIGTASTEQRRDFVLKLGADAAISYDEPDWPTTVLELTGGRGVDVLIESIGGDVFEQNFAALAPFGRYFIVGLGTRTGRTIRAATVDDKISSIDRLLFAGFLRPA